MVVAIQNASWPHATVESRKGLLGSFGLVTDKIRAVLCQNTA